MDGRGPLRGVRVLDLTEGQGRYGARPLAELGADVLRVAPTVERGPDIGTDHGLLEWWYDANCQRLPLDVADDDQRAELIELAGRADVVLDDAAPGRLDEHGVGPAVLAAANPSLVHVSLTPFGATGPRARWASSDLVAQALSGHLSVTGDVDEPIVLWGRQSAVVGGLYAASSALAGLHRARASGHGSWVDLSLHEALVSCTEHLLMYWWYPEALAPLGAPVAGRQRSLHWIRAFEVVPCARGACMVSPAAGGLLDLIAWLKERGHAGDVPDEPGEEELLSLVPPLMEALRAVALETDATELFLAGQSLHVPFGESYAIEQVARCAQHVERGFFRAVDDEPSVVIPGPVARFARSPAPAPRRPTTAASTAEVLERWSPREPFDGETAPSGRPLDGVRVLDFTHVLAGPFATRILGDLGADVIRVQTDERSAGTADNAFPYNVMWARNKRSIQLAMKHPDALVALRPLVEQADVVVDNFSVGVMASWGAGPEELARWNPRIVTMSMSGCGHDGPWREFVTYAPTVHALCGLTALTGPPGQTDCGPGVAYNDHLSGLLGATSLLAALAERAESGQGQHIDLSQLEVGTHLVGPAVIDHLATGRSYRSEGNRDPFADLVVNDVFPTADEGWLAVTVIDDDEWARVADAIGATEVAELASWAAGRPAAEGAERLQGAGIAAGMVAGAADLSEADPQLAHRDWLVTMDGELTGPQPTERHPARWYQAGSEIELSYRPSPYLGQHNFEVYGELVSWDEARVAEAIGDELIL